jgi:outer membrane protein assembly factor BamB
LFVLNIKGELVWKKGPEAVVTAVPESETPNTTPAGTASEPQSGTSTTDCPPPPAPCGNVPSGADGGAQGGPSGMEIEAGAEVIAGIITPALTPDGLIYIGNPQGKLMAIDSKTQEIKWSYQTGKNPDPKGIDFGLPSFIITDKDGTAYLGAFDHKFYAISKDGKVKWSYETGDKITEASPAIGADGTIYFTSEDGYVYAIGE